MEPAPQPPPECQAGHVQQQPCWHSVVCLAPAQGMFTWEQGRVHGQVSGKRLSHPQSI